MPTDTALPAASPGDTRPSSILAAPYRAATLGMVALVSLNAFESLAVAAAMPTVARELNGLPLYALAFGGTLATSVVGMTAAGRWSDRRGPGGTLAYGLLCFVIGLLVAGLAPGMPVLIAGRLLQGLGAGAYSVALYVIVGRLYPEAMRPRVFAAFSAGWVVPSLIGPGISGLIVQHVGWRWVFLSVPLLAIPAGLMLWPAIRGRTWSSDTAGASDSALRWAVGAALGVLGVYLGGQLHGTSALLAMAPALVISVCCAWQLLPTGTLRLARGLPGVIALRSIAAAAFFGFEAFLPLLLSRERGLSPLLAGVALSVGALGWFSGSWYQGHSRAGWSRPRLLKTGACFMSLGIVISAGAVWPVIPVPVAIAGWALTGLGMGLLYPSLSVLTLSLSPPAQQGANSSALQLSEAIAVAGMLALAGALFAALLAWATAAAYLSVFALAWLLAVAGFFVARRV
ncbi:MFS transporter [Xanthomonas arboricola pv. populi]|uniref:MFS transporter n=1 Tax=Xanthomonas arboricola pv. populi TaxID=487823 RepID=A0A2S6Z5Y5_9XANT|nr:MFS transporter [Xanthomonas arboricola]PPT76898.1 MFS transporter [Xanthomonas arboricola pv. populi]